MHARVHERVCAVGMGARKRTVGPGRAAYIYLSIYLSISISIYLSIYLSVAPSLHLSIHLSPQAVHAAVPRGGAARGPC